MYFTYVLYSVQFNKIYVGFSGDIQNRLIIHNSFQNTGWTAKYRPWLIIHSEEFETKKEAMTREKELKTSRGRAFIWQKVDDYKKDG